MGWDFEAIAGPFGGPVDGLVWDGAGLLFSVVPERRILRYQPDSGEISEFRRYMTRVRGMALDQNGTLFACQSGSRRIIRFNADGSVSPLEQRLNGRLHNFPDDLIIDSRGRVWFSDPYDTEPGHGAQLHGPLPYASVLRLSLEGGAWGLRRMTFDTAAPKGILLSPDERTLYLADSSDEPDGPRELRAYDVNANGSLGEPRVLHTFGADRRGVHRGIDGMCLAADGSIVAVAGWERSGPGPLVYHFAPSGRVLATHPVPADQPIDCALAGADLYVSTAEGRLYRVRNAGLS